MRVQFPTYTHAGKEVIRTGTVIDQFREPKDEDHYQRLNYVIRTDDGQTVDAYADDCREIA